MQDTVISNPDITTAAPAAEKLTTNIALALGILALSGLLLWHASGWMRLLALGLGAVSLVLLWQLTRQPALGSDPLLRRLSQVDSVQVDLSPLSEQEHSDPAFAAFSARLRQMLLGLQQQNLRIAMDSAKTRKASQAAGVQPLPPASTSGRPVRRARSVRCAGGSTIWPTTRSPGRPRRCACRSRRCRRCRV